MPAANIPTIKSKNAAYLSVETAARYKLTVVRKNTTAGQVPVTKAL